jgi:outer membrane protein assembly factor BamB
MCSALRSWCWSCLPIALAIAAVGMAASAQTPRSSPDWPHWRGPGGQGIALETRLPQRWPTGPIAPLWETPIAEGWSSPVVADGRVFVTDRQDDHERLVALDADTGRQLWQQTNRVDFDPHPVGRRHGNGPKSTPLVSGGRVFSLGIAGWLQCANARDGKRLWSVDFPAAFGARQPLPDGRAFVNREDNVIVPVGDGQGAPVPLFGYTGSLAAEGRFLICSVGGERAGTVVAFDQASGQVAWKALDEHVSYSSPVVATLGGVKQVVVMTGPRVVGLGLADGRLLWSYPFQVQYDESISTPVVDGNFVLVSGDGHPMTAVAVEGQGERMTARLAWENDDLTSYLSSMVIAGGHVYGMNDGGEFNCVRLEDGKTVWTGGKHGYYCTPVLAGKRLLCLNDRGSLLVLAANPEQYLELGQNRLSASPTWTSPAVIGSRLYIRSQQSVRCFDLEGKEGPGTADGR